MAEPLPDPHEPCDGDLEYARNLLVSFMEVSDRFALAFAVCNTLEASLGEIEEISRRLAPRGRRLATVRLDTCPRFLPPVDVLDEQLRKLGAPVGPATHAIMIAGLGAHVPYGTAQSPVLSALNMARDLFPSHFPCPMIFFVSEYLMTMIARQAPDFAAWASLTVQCAQPVSVTERQASEWRDGIHWTELGRGRLSPDRFSTLEGLLQDCVPDVPGAAMPNSALAKDVLRELLYANVDLELRERLVGLLRALRGAAEAVGDRGLTALALVIEAANTASADVAGGACKQALALLHDVSALALGEPSDERLRVQALDTLADTLARIGELDEALRIRREEQLPVYERLGDVRSRAVTMGKIADILYERGELDEALRIPREEVLPVYDRLGDVRSRAVTMGRIADILYQRGELDEALRIRREEELPVYERLGDVRSRAVTMGKIANILYQRGELDEALRICREEVLPVYERLGDVRSRAVTMGQIADILYARGELDEALRIRREEALPAFERLGDVRELLVGRAWLATTLQKRGAPGDREEAVGLLRMALDAARQMRLPRECEWIEGILRSLGEDVQTGGLTRTRSRCSSGPRELRGSWGR